LQHKTQDQSWLQGVSPIANDQLFHQYTSTLYIHRDGFPRASCLFPLHML
jgi:hypothetical protein